MEEPDRVPQTVHEGQLAIDVPSAAGAIGKWGPDEQFSAYSKEFGQEKALEQKRALEEAQKCSCGEQAKEDAKAKQEQRRAQRLVAWKHGAGCPKYSSPPKLGRHVPNEDDLRKGF